MKTLTAILAFAITATTHADGLWLPVYAWEKQNAALHVQEYLQPYSVATPKSWAFPAAYTGHRSVCWLSGATTNMSFDVWVGGDEYAPGEAFAYVRRPDANGYRAAEPVRRSATTPRINLVTGTSDRAETIEDYYVTISNRYIATIEVPAERQIAIDQFQWRFVNRYEPAAVSADNGELTRVRVVRWLVDGTPVYNIGAPAEVVFDKMMNLAEHPTLTEADLLADGAFDIDWDNLAIELQSDEVRLSGLESASVAYLVVIGDGPVMWDGSTDSETILKVVNQVIDRRYEVVQTLPRIVSPTNAPSVAYGAHPTFKWETPVRREFAYTAFQMQVLPATGSTNTVAAVFDSGVQPMPPRDAGGRYFWTAPVRVGSGLSASTTYRWRVRAMNAKFKDPAWSATQTFSTAAQ